MESLSEFYDKKLKIYAENISCEKLSAKEAEQILKNISQEVWKLAWLEWARRLNNSWIQPPSKNMQDLL